MQTGSAKNLDSSERRAEKRIENPEAKPNEKIEELRKKIRSGFYESKEVMLEIVNRLLNDIKQSNK